MPHSRENVIFDDVVIKSKLYIHKYTISKFWKQILHVFSKTCHQDDMYQNSKNTFKFLKVIHGRLTVGPFPHTSSARTESHSPLIARKKLSCTELPERRHLTQHTGKCDRNEWKRHQIVKLRKASTYNVRLVHWQRIVEITHTTSWQ